MSAARGFQGNGRPGASSRHRILRQSTFISPTTGERQKRDFSLRDSSSWFSEHHTSPDEREPLLPRENARCQPRKGIVAKSLEKGRNAPGEFWEFANSTTGRNVFKCSIAYLLGSLATFVQPISKHLGKQDSKHMVATVTVWFHPARTLGSMHQATILGTLGFCYAAFISFTSMAISMLFGSLDLLRVGHGIVLVVFCGAGLGAIAWLKQRLGHPLVNVGCSLASLGCITVLVKEGAVQAGEFSETSVVNVLVMVAAGMAISTLVNMIILPKRARMDLCRDITKNTDFLGELLVAVTRAFLDGNEYALQDEYFKKVITDHQSSLNALKKDLSEAKFEHYLLGTESRYEIESRLVQCLSRLSQSLGGLRSAAFSQFTLLKEVNDMSRHSKQRRPSWNSINDYAVTPSSTVSTPKILDSITEAPEFDEGHGSAAQENTTGRHSRKPSIAANHGDLFETFIEQLGPPTKSLVYTMKQILDVLPFADDKPYRVAVNEQFHSSLTDAISLYKESRQSALDTLYQNRAFHAARSLETLADVEEVCASCGHFSFALLDFAEDILEYLDILEALKMNLEAKLHRSWKWVMFWRKGMRRHSSIEVLSTDPAIQQRNIPEAIKHADAFADSARTYGQDRPWYYGIYRNLSVFRRDDVRFAIKVGVGAALYALPAFIETTRPFFSHWRGEWGLVSYMVVCSMTIGASNTTGLNRFFGTGVGAILAIVAWLLSNARGVANPWILGFFGWLVAYGCFYIILAQGNGPMGRFILLTSNLGALYAYSLSVKDDDNDDDEGGIDPAIWEIVLHRVVSVIVGCVWAIVITRLIWPISARKKMKQGLCVLWMRMSLIWKRDPLAMLLLGTPKSSYMDIREEADLVSFLAYLDSLKKGASSEFELRGPFPEASIARILERTSRMLDAFHALNMVISKDMKCSPGEATVLKYTRYQRYTLSSRISHLFSVLASSVKLEYPLNDVLPNIDNSRDQLLARIYEFRRSGEGRETVQEQDYELIYAYVLVTGQLAQDIKVVSTELETLYGTLNEENFKLQ